MINYPNAKKHGSFTAEAEENRLHAENRSAVRYPGGRQSRYDEHRTPAGRRGMDLEKDINTTNQAYLQDDLAVIHKKPTPVQIVKVDYPKRSAARITEAYFKIPSTTDYNGIYRGKYIDFEAKECHLKTSFPLKSIHPHQIDHLDAVARHGAIAFLIIRFNLLYETFYLPAQDAISFFRERPRSSMPIAWLKEKAYIIPETVHYPVDYLKVIDRLYFNEKGD